MTRQRHGRLSVLALVPYPLGQAPGQRYRIEQWAPYLAREGIDVTFLPFAPAELASILYEPGRLLRKARGMARSFLLRLREVWGAGRYDVVFVYREAALVGPAWLERIAAARNPRIVYDFDDAIWLRYVSPRNRYFSYLKAPAKTSTICRIALTVTVGNEHLAGFARRYNRSVTVIPSTVSLAAYEPRPLAWRQEVPVVGWTGSHSSAQYLRLIERPLRDLAVRRRFRFVAVGLDELEMSGVDVECRPWRSESEARDLWDFDVGVMPLPDDPWAQGKCAMKAIQYLAVGTPAVVSPVGVNRDLVRHGETGFHAVTEEDWLTYLDNVLSDEPLRRRLGSAGRHAVEEEYSAEVQAPRMAQVLREVVS